jgi:hypothetical protein
MINRNQELRHPDAPRDLTPAIKAASEQISLYLSSALESFFVRHDLFELAAAHRDRRWQTAINTLAARHVLMFAGELPDIDKIVSSERHLRVILETLYTTLQEDALFYKHASHISKGAFVAEALPQQEDFRNSTLPPRPLAVVPAAEDLVAALEALRRATGQHWFPGFRAAVTKGWPDLEIFGGGNDDELELEKRPDRDRVEDEGVIMRSFQEGLIHKLCEAINAGLKQAALPPACTVAGLSGLDGTFITRGLFLPAAVFELPEFRDALKSVVASGLDPVAWLISTYGIETI